MMESLTRDLADRARALIQEVEDQGGMAKAIDAGLPKLALKNPRRTNKPIDRGEDVIVGLTNTSLRPKTKSMYFKSTMKRSGCSIAQLNKLRAERDEAKVQQALTSITDIAGGAEGNLLAAAIDAIRARATVGEVSDAMEVHFDRYKAEHRSVSGVYGSHYEKDETWMSIGDKIQAFSEKDGRRPRVLVAKMGQDGHDRGAKVVATAFADVGFDVDLSPMFSTPKKWPVKRSRMTCMRLASARWLPVT